MNKFNQKKLLNFIKEECKKNNIKLVLRKSKYVRVNKTIRSAGFLDEAKRELVCAINNPNFIIILAHEWCHVEQWLSKCCAWKEYNKKDTYIFDEWLAGKNFDNKKVFDIIKVSINMELDNEKRTRKLLSKFGMSKIKLESYTQNANAYILFYLYIAESRKWYKANNVPYENKKILSCMSKKFNMNYDKLSHKIRNVFIKEKI